MRYYSDDPAMDEARYTRALDMKLARRPKCHCCGHHIQDNEALHYVSKNLDIWLCLECIEDNTELIED